MSRVRRHLALLVFASLVLAACKEGKEQEFNQIVGGPETPTPTPSSSDSRTVPAGCSGMYEGAPSLCATPIKAVFDPGAKQTIYTVQVSGGAAVTALTQLAASHGTPYVYHYQWSGPNCGFSAPTQEVTRTDSSFQTLFTWSHPHPPCGNTTDHQDVTVKLITWVETQGHVLGSLTCSYQGSADGTGQACVSSLS